MVTAIQLLSKQKKAKRVIRKNNILINNLHAFVLPQMAALQRPENVHFTKEGSRALGEKVSQVISAYLCGEFGKG